MDDSVIILKDDNGNTIGEVSLEDGTKILDNNINKSYANIKKKPCYSKLQKCLKKLEDKLDILNNDLIKPKQKIDNIKEIRSKKKSKIRYEVISDSSDSKETELSQLI